MKLVFICSPLRGDYAENIKRTQYLCATAARRYDVIPIAPHIYFTQFLRDSNPGERELGTQMGLELLGLCDEVWVDGMNDPSEGMVAEIEAARIAGIPVRDLRDYLGVNQR